MSRIPEKVKSVLDDYVQLMNAFLPNTLAGLYLHGSIALNAYVENASDIDFVTITSRPLVEKDKKSLREIHRILAEKYEKPEMDGVYILGEDLGRLEADRYHFYYNGGTVSKGAYFNAVNWWILKNKGIGIIGPEPDTLHFEVKPEHLSEYVLENMNEYWADRIVRIENAKDRLLELPVEQMEAEVEWTVLGLLRQYFTLQEQDIASKQGAGEYSLQQLPTEWHHVIKEAINIRAGVQERIFTSNEERVNALIRFSKYLIKHCNDNFKEC